MAAIGGCTIYVTLYLIRRSGDGWERFGVVRPGPLDVGGGLVLLFAADVTYRAVADLAGPGGSAADPYPRPRGSVEYALMVVKYGVSALAEELVTRAYLITRLAVLLRSPAAAVFAAAGAFASYHAYQGAFGVASAFAFGAAYGLAFLVVRRVWPLAVAHAIVNIRLDL